MTEHVFGSETSSDVYAHLDFKIVDSAFKRFGLMGLAYDLYSGFYGEEDSRSHNFFCQNDLYPEEQTKGEKKNTNTAHWMRIDFESSSFPFDKKKFIEACISEKEKMRRTFVESESLNELYFLMQYCNILENKPIEDKNKLENCVQKIRQKHIKAVLLTQADLCKRAGDPSCMDQGRGELNQFVNASIAVEVKKVVTLNEEIEKFNQDIIKYKMNRGPRNRVPDFLFSYQSVDNEMKLAAQPKKAATPCDENTMVDDVTAKQKSSRTTRGTL
jgi:hypothetical protein